jgi:hypothetical protein
MNKQDALNKVSVLFWLFIALMVLTLIVYAVTNEPSARIAAFVQAAIAMIIFFVGSIINQLKF